MAGPALAGGAQHYVWDDGIGQYGGPAAAVVNNSGAMVWWQVPGTDGRPDSTMISWYKDVYKTHDFGGSTEYDVEDLNEPVRTLIENAFPDLVSIYYTREVVYGAPSFPNATEL